MKTLIALSQIYCTKRVLFELGTQLGYTLVSQTSFVEDTWIDDHRGNGVRSLN